MQTNAQIESQVELVLHQYVGIQKDIKELVQKTKSIISQDRPLFYFADTLEQLITGKKNLEWESFIDDELLCEDQYYVSLGLMDANQQPSADFMVDVMRVFFDENSTEMLYVRAVQSFNKKEYAFARELFIEGLKTSQGEPGKERFLLGLGSMSIVKKEFEEARDWYRAINNNSYLYLEKVQGLMFSAIGLGDKKTALKHARTYVRKKQVDEMDDVDLVGLFGVFPKNEREWNYVLLQAKIKLLKQELRTHDVEYWVQPTSDVYSPSFIFEDMDTHQLTLQSISRILFPRDSNEKFSVNDISFESLYADIIPREVELLEAQGYKHVVGKQNSINTYIAIVGYQCLCDHIDDVTQSLATFRTDDRAILNLELPQQPLVTVDQATKQPVRWIPEYDPVLFNNWGLLPRELGLPDPVYITPPSSEETYPYEPLV